MHSTPIDCCYSHRGEKTRQRQPTSNDQCTEATLESRRFFSSEKEVYSFKTASFSSLFSDSSSIISASFFLPDSCELNVSYSFLDSHAHLAELHVLIYGIFEFVLELADMVFILRDRGFQLIHLLQEVVSFLLHLGINQKAASEYDVHLLVQDLILPLKESVAARHCCFPLCVNTQSTSPQMEKNE